MLNEIKIWLILILVICTIALCGCNANRQNTEASRAYTAFITKYNISYNGEKHFKETLAEMEKGYADDYSCLLFTHPIEAKSDSLAPQPVGDFTRSIEKAEKAIKMRSIPKRPRGKAGMKKNKKYQEWMSRSEYNPTIHNAWMMLGRSQYFNGEFAKASNTFYYVWNHFSWLPSVSLEAKIWQVQSNISQGSLYDAFLLLNDINAESISTPSLQRIYSRAYAEYWIRKSDFKKATPYVEKCMEVSKGAQRTRLGFLLAQLYAVIGEKEKAYDSFQKIIKSVSTPYRIKLNALIKQTEITDGMDNNSKIKRLERYARQSRNEDFLPQIHHAIANLLLVQKDTAEALVHLKKAVSENSNEETGKALAQLALANIYYDQNEYLKSQKLYHEAVPKLNNKIDDNLYKRISVLDQVAVFEENIKSSTSSKEIGESLFKIGSIFYEQLDDRIRARAVLNRLINDYPENNFMLDAYHLLFLMSVREGDNSQAENYRKLMVDKFPDSRLAIEMSVPNYIDRLHAADKQAQDAYEKAFECYKANDVAAVREIYAFMKNNYPMSTLMPKFAFLNALAFSVEKDNTGFYSSLRTLVQDYPNADVAPLAQTWIKAMDDGRTLHAKALSGQDWPKEQNLEDATAVHTEEDACPFTHNPNDKHFLLLIIENADVSANQLLYDVARFNFGAFLVKDYDLDTRELDSYTLVRVGPFANKQECLRYVGSLSQSSSFNLLDGVKPVQISAPDFDELLRKNRSLPQYLESIHRLRCQEPLAQ